MFTDSNFIKQLKELPPIDIKKSNNLFEEIFDMILKYLGIEKGDSAYKQAFSVATNILEEERFNVNRSEDLFEMQKYEDSLRSTQLFNDFEAAPSAKDLGIDDENITTTDFKCK